MRRSKQIEELLDQADALEERLRAWQEAEPPPSPAELRAGARDYRAWYAKALQLVPEESKDHFKDMYEGGTFVSRIRAFLDEPRTLNEFFDPALEGNPLAPSRFRFPFDTNFRDNFTRQRAALEMAAQTHGGPTEVLDELTELFARLPAFLRVLRSAESANVPPPTLERESDLQVLVHALLRTRYDDVRAEDYVSQVAGGNSRVDFSLPGTGVVIETKMTRPSLNDRKVGEELLIDWGRYPRHPDCQAIFALVYDPGQLLLNPAGLTNDLSQPDGDPVTRVLVVH